MEALNDYKDDVVGKIQQTAKKVFGIGTVKPFQLLVMKRILEQDVGAFVRHQLVILPTGTGKSLCFLVPALLCKGVTIIVYPLLALMNDQMSKLKNAGLDCVVLRGGQTKEQRSRLWQKLDNAVKDNSLKIVMTTPETLLQESVLKKLSCYRISLFVIDEAHVISQWGKDFRPKYSQLKRAVFSLLPKQILAFTATASKSTVKEIIDLLFPSKPLVVRGDADRENIIYAVYPALECTHATVSIIKDCKKPAIVFCRTRHEVEQVCFEIARDLVGRNIPARYYHAGLSREERERLEEWFSKTRDGVLVTTCAFGMGVDVKSIRTVVHYNLPQTVEEYLQESGRAGRDGELSVAWVLMDLVKENAVAEKDHKTKTLTSIFEGNECRRQGLLRALGEEKKECTGCDVCLKIVKEKSSDEITIRNFIKLFSFRYTIEKASYILVGNKDSSALSQADTCNPFFGALAHWNFKRLKQALERLCRDNVSGIKGLSFFIPKTIFSKTAKKGKLLYPSDISIYNFIALILGRLNNGYCWIVRKNSWFTSSLKHWFSKRFKLVFDTIREVGKKAR